MAAAKKIKQRVVLIVIAASGIAACGSPSIVNTDEPRTPIETPVPTPGLPQHATNEHLADASEFYATSDGRKAYFFTSPSARWRCAIVPREQAGCQAAGSARLTIAGAPTSVPDADGTPSTPNAVVIDRDGDAGFAALEPNPFSLLPGPATTLPFNTVLAVAGFRCNIQEASGVSCGSEASGKGFTFSAEGYAPSYTDVPQ